MTTQVVLLSTFNKIQLAKMPGQSCGSEVTNLMANSNKRADVVLYKGMYNVLTNVRTIAGGDQLRCGFEPRLWRCLGCSAERRRLACSGSEPGGHFSRPAVPATPAPRPL